MNNYTSYPRKAIESGTAMHPVDVNRFAKCLPHAIHKMPDWEFFRSYLSESKVAFVKPLTEPDVDGQIECAILSIPLA